MTVAAPGAVVCDDCGLVTISPFNITRLEFGVLVTERRLCEPCATRRKLPTRAMARPAPAPVGHSGEPWIFPPEAVGPPPPPAPRLWVKTIEGQLWIRVSDEEQADGWAPPAPVERPR